MAEYENLTLGTEDVAAESRKGLDLSTIVLMVGVLAVVAVIGFALIQRNNAQLGVGATAPDFELTTFDGEVIRLSDLRGQVVVVNFWAQWCAPCREEADDLQATWEAFQDQGVMFVGVAWADFDTTALAYLAEYGITYPNGLDEGTRIADRYNVSAVPETFILDRDGKIAYFIPAPLSQSRLSSMINDVLVG